MLHVTSNEEDTTLAVSDTLPTTSIATEAIADSQETDTNEDTKAENTTTEENTTADDTTTVDNTIEDTATEDSKAEDTQAPATTPAPNCWICYEAGSPDRELIAPCKCKGSVQFVHQDCLLAWLDSSDTSKLTSENAHQNWIPCRYNTFKLRIRFLMAG